MLNPRRPIGLDAATLIFVGAFSLACSSGPAPRLEQTHEGRLEEGDEVLTRDSCLGDAYTFEARDGEQITLEMSSSDVDSYLALYDADGHELAVNDDEQSRRRDSRIEIEAPSDGVFRVVASSFERETGDYTLRIAVAPP